MRRFSEYTMKRIDSDWWRYNIQKDLGFRAGKIDKILPSFSNTLPREEVRPSLRSIWSTGRDNSARRNPWGINYEIG